MHKLAIHLFVWILLFAMDTQAQNSPKLFTFDANSVFADEFKNECQSFVKQYDTAEIHNLFNEYVNYRLEAYDAHKRRLDTSSQYKQAVEYYNNYLIVDHVVSSAEANKYLQEVIDRAHYQYRLSYIKINIPANSKTDTSVAYKKALSVKARILNGQSFAKAARQVSDDPSANFNGGYLGWVSPIDFNVGYQAENYIVNHFSDSTLSRPIRSGNYYYLIKVQGRRPAIGSISVSAILKYKKKSWQYNDSLKKVFESMAADLKSGVSFSTLQARNSDYPYTEQELPLKEAYNKFSTQIADIKSVGKCSDVIENTDFFCIVRLDKENPTVFDDNYNDYLKMKFFGTDRFKTCYDNFMDSVKQMAKYKKLSDYKPLYKLFPDSAIYEGKWEPGYLGFYSDNLFTLNQKNYTQADFAEYVYKTQCPTPYNSINNYLSEKYNEYVNSLLLLCASDYLKNDQVYKSKMQIFSNYELYGLSEKFQKFEQNARDTDKVYNYYVNSSLSYKTNHVLYIRFYDYLTAQNRKKALKFANQLVSDNDLKISESVMKLSRADTFRLGVYDLADTIIKGFDSNIYFGDKQIPTVIDLESAHTLALVTIVERPKDLAKEDLFPLVAPQYFRYLKSNYAKSLRSKYNLEISSDADNIIKTLF